MSNIYRNIEIKHHNVLIKTISLCFLISMLSFFGINDFKPMLPFLDIYYLRHFIFGMLLLGLVIYIIYTFNCSVYLNKTGLVFFLVCTIALLLLFFFRDSINISDFLRFVVLFPFLFIQQGIDVKKKLKKIYVWLIICNSIFLSFTQGFIFNDYWNEAHRFIFNSNDPNFSAIYLLLGFMVCYKLGYKFPKYIFFLMGALTQSRNFILGIIVFYLIKYTENNPFVLMIFGRIKPIFMLIIMQVAIILFGYWYIVSVEPRYGRETLFLNDASNFARFTFSTQGFFFLASGSKMAIVDGAGERYWARELEGKKTVNIEGTVHNSFLDLFVSKGIIYGILNIIILFVIVDKYRTSKNYKYIYTYLVMSLFLSGLTSGFFLLNWLYILAIKDFS